MIVINGKTYRNLEEQVKKNMDDITELQNKSSSDVTKEYVDTQDQALQGQITENTTDITELKSKTQANTTNIAALETSKQNTLSQAQLNATNSGITANKVSKYDGYENTKQGKLTAGDNITISADNVISATGGGTSDVTKAYVDAQDAKLEQSINATNTEVSKKLNKMTSTGSGVKAYIHENGVDRLLNATSDKTRNLIVRWDDNAQLHANAGTTDDAVVNKKQMEDAIANKLDKATTTSGSYAYCRNGNRDETIPVNSLVGTDAIVRRTSTGTIKANAGVDENDCVNKKQLDDAIAGVSGSDVTKEYVDNGLAGKLDKLENTSDRTECYVNQAGTNRLLNTSTNATRNLIVRWDNAGRLHSNAATTGDEVVNKEQLDAAIAGVSGGGAQLNVANTWTAVQTFNAGLTTAGALNIAGQGSINITGDISCDGLTLAGGDILQGGTGNFSSLVTSFGDGGLQFTTTQVPVGTHTLFKVTYKYNSSNWIDTYKVTTTKHGYTKILITNEDINSTDFTWNKNDRKLALNTRIVSCDQTFYDGLTNKDKNTLYVIVE